MEIKALCEYPEYINTVAEWTWEEFCKVDRPSIAHDDIVRNLKAQKLNSLPQTFIALEGKTLLGTITMYENYLKGEDYTPWMGSLFVPFEHRSFGVAKRLIGKVKEESLKLGFNTLYVRTEHACGYYEKNGWEFVKETVDMEHNLNTTVYKTGTAGYRVEKLNDAWNSVRLFDDNAGSYATIATEKGANLMQFFACGREIIYLAGETINDTPERVREGTPILFPTCGRTVNETYTLDGKEYKMSIHGFASGMAWKVLDASVEDGASVTVCLEANAETLEMYPFDFKVFYTFTLKGDKLTIAQKFMNLSDKRMPFSSGVHPYFKADNPKSYVVLDGEKISFADEIDAVFDVKTKPTVVFESGLGHSVTVKADDNYKHYVFYTTLANFACAEPWTAAPNAINTGDNLIWIDAKSEKELLVSFEASLNK